MDGKKIKICLVGSSGGHLTHVLKDCILDNKKLRDLGWRGQYSLMRGIKETYDYLKKQQ